MLLFNHKIFNEVAYAVYRIWSTKYTTFRNNKTQKKTALFPSFSNFFGFEAEEKSFSNTLSFSDDSSISEIVEASEEGIEELARELFLSKKIKYLNLQEVKSTHLNRSESIVEFTQFMKTISKAVFLSA
jgi:1-deoxy-D-xylulose 5-phosphate reductoisomerase